MGNMDIENTLFLGNGFSRNVFKGIPSREELFEGQTGGINNYTILYEVYLLKSKNKEENDVKEYFKGKIRNYVSEKSERRYLWFEIFWRIFEKNRVNNIITTNYDSGIEIILSNFSGYERVENPVRLVPEEIYSIRMYKEFENSEKNHRVKLWQIHGDMDRIKSITLGFDHYCGALAKLSDYLKGYYESKRCISCNTFMIEKCETNKFDGIS